MAADDDADRAAFRQGRGGNRDDLAGRGVQSGFLPDFGARREVGRVAEGGVPAGNEVRVVSHGARDAFLRLDAAREILGRGVGGDLLGRQRHISLDALV